MKVLNFKNFFKDENERSKLLKFNIIGLFILKFISITVSFLMVPLTIGYLTTYDYGIWITISAILIWVDFFDIGIGHGLRNNLATAFANNDFELGKKLVSTAIAFTTILSIIFFAIFSIINPFLNWTKILNIDAHTGSEVGSIVFWVFLFVCIRFVFKLFGTILAADQRTVVETLIGVIGNVLSIIVIYILTKTTSGSLKYAAISLSAIPPLTFGVAGLFLFNGRYKKIKPEFQFIDKRYVRDLLGLGMKFFIIQISCLLIFTSSDFIIIHYFGPKDVTVYNIAYKYFSLIIMVFSIVSTPLWSAFTHAYAKKDFPWIKTTVNRLQKFWFACLIAVLIMIIFAKAFFFFWVGNTIIVPFFLVLSLGAYAIVTNLLATYNYVINGTGKVFIQTIYSIFSMMVYVPLAYVLSKKFGVSGAINATTFILIPQIIITYIQYRKIVIQTANGIWNR